MQTLCKKITRKIIKENHLQKAFLKIPGKIGHSLGKKLAKIAKEKHLQKIVQKNHSQKSCKKSLAKIIKEKCLQKSIGKTLKKSHTKTCKNHHLGENYFCVKIAKQNENVS